MPVAEEAPVVLYDETQDRRLAEVFAPCFTLILHLRVSHEFGDAEVLRRRIKDLLDTAERDARRGGFSSEDLRAAKFAIVAFIDETILSSDWSQKERWIARPLQLEVYDRYDAGEEFFVRLESLLASPAANAEVLEVYYMCMTLGFKGRYQLHDQERLRILIEDTYKVLNRTPGFGASELSPHGKPRGQVATEVQSKLPVWVIIVFAAALALLIYLGMSLYMSATADDAARDIEQQIPRTTSTLE